MPEYGEVLWSCNGVGNGQVSHKEFTDPYSVLSYCFNVAQAGWEVRRLTRVQ